MASIPEKNVLLGYFMPDGELIYAGRVGTGMTVAELERLYARLEPLAIPKMPLSERHRVPVGSVHRSCCAVSIGCGRRWLSRSSSPS
jgi:ATP-dependent DNA ligase